MVGPHRTVSSQPLLRVPLAMEVNVDQRQPVLQPMASQEASPHQGVLRVTDVPDSLIGPGARRYSFWAECECPGDCLRDHENE